MALELLREFRSRRDEGRGLASTRLLFVSFDAEEAGLRGARAWAKARASEISGLPTWHYNMDCVYKAQDARFLTSDINGSVKLSVPLAQACAAAAREAGVPTAVEPAAVELALSVGVRLAERLDSGDLD